HISFYPNTFTNTRVGVTYKFSDVNVRKGESVSLTVKFRYNQRIYFDIATAWIGPNPFLIQKIVFSKMETGELIKEVKRNGLIKPVSPGFLLFTLEITDEILSIQGECYEK
ncbi:MAG: hypothetical protein FWC91_14110, partial [Defluviitaleaceae bacterium]|nr:hypothetical protein [Defluviitaleaceae bacterium]